MLICMNYEILHCEVSNVTTLKFDGVIVHFVSSAASLHFDIFGKEI